MGSVLDMLPDVRHQRFALGVLDDGSLDLPAALEDALNANLAGISSAAPFECPRLAVLVHVPRLAADVGFVNFHLATQLAAVVLVLHGQANPVQHEPRGLLGDAKRPMQFPRTDAVLGSGNHPHSREPLVQPEWGVFKDGAELYGELGLGVAGSALEHPPRLDEANVSGPAGWTANPFRPAPRNEITQAIIWICEVNNCFHEGYWFRGGHKSILRQIAR